MGFDEILDNGSSMIRLIGNKYEIFLLIIIYESALSSQKMLKPDWLSENKFIKLVCKIVVADNKTCWETNGDFIPGKAIRLLSKKQVKNWT